MLVTIKDNELSHMWNRYSFNSYHAVVQRITRMRISMFKETIFGKFSIIDLKQDFSFENNVVISLMKMNKIGQFNAIIYVKASMILS